MKNKNPSVIDSLIESISKIEGRQIGYKILIAAAIADGMTNKGLNKSQFVSAIGRRVNINKWLSGTHNFTIDTLAEIEEVLDIELIKTC